MRLTVSRNERLDVLLLSAGAVLSRAKAQAAIKTGRVKIDGVVILKPSRILHPGEKVELREEKNKEDAILAENLKLKVLYEDEDCLVIDKPRGIAVHPGAGMPTGEKTILTGLAYIFSKRPIPFSAAQVLVHRLDKETSGCLIIAKNPAAQIKLQEEFQNRKVDKTYLALVNGIPSPARAMIDADIGRNLKNRTKMSVNQSTKNRRAFTTYRTISSANGAALLELDLHTGRTHQIRVHLSAIGHPVLGDRKYGNRKSGSISDEYGIDFLCLHAWKLRFKSPGGKKVAVTSGIPEDFQAAMRVLGLA